MKLDEKAKLAQQQRTEEGVAADVQPLLDTNAYRDAALIWAYLQALEGVKGHSTGSQFSCHVIMQYRYNLNLLTGHCYRIETQTSRASNMELSCSVKYEGYVPRVITDTRPRIQSENTGVQVFKDPSNPPDKEFGCFAAVFGPPGTEWQDKALLRIDVGSAKGKAAAKSTPAVLVTIPIADLHRSVHIYIICEGWFQSAKEIYC